MASTQPTPTAPEWMTPGAQVAEYTSSGNTSHPSVEFTTIERLTKTQVVLANGERYRIEAKPRRRTGTWTPAIYLLPAGDPTVVEAHQQQRRRNVRANTTLKVEPLLTRWRCDGDDGAAREALRLLTVAVAHLDTLAAEDVAP